MVRYTLTELNNKSGEIVEAAHSGPVEITSRGKRKFVLMTAAQFDRLVGVGAQRSYHAASLTDEEREEFVAALDAVAAEGGHTDA